jgi:cell division control protein 7
MAKTKAIRLKPQDYQIPIHEDLSADDNGASEMDETEDEAQSPLSRGASSSDEDAECSEEELEQSVAEDMARFEDTFKGISDRYRLINRIGEGTAMSSSLHEKEIH